MTRAQRILLITSLAISAAFLHFKLCAWRFESAAVPGSNVMAFWREVPLGGTGAVGWVGTGVFANGEGGFGDANIALLAGVMIPFALLVAATYLVFGWRRAERVASGRCVQCGHQRASSPPCPECGSTKPQ